MTNILLCSENFMRANFEISDNLQSKFLLPAIREVQDVKYKSIIGQPLYEKLISLVESNEIMNDENKAYLDLIDESRLFIGYAAIADLCVKTTIKLDNMGLNRTKDEMLDVLPMSEMFQMKDYYTNKADSYCKYLQNYLLEHKDELKELTEHQCTKIHSNLYSSASCNMWLGGARGKGYKHIHYGYNKN